MMRWLHRFFYSDDPIVKVAGGFSEFDAGICEELLNKGGILCMKKNMDALSGRYWRPMLPSANNFTLWVKRSDLNGARKLLVLPLRPAQLVALGQDDETGREDDW